MNSRLNVSALIAFAILAALMFGSCIPVVTNGTQAARATSTPGEIPTWTPRPGDQTALPTATKPVSVELTPSATPVLADAPPIVPTPKAVSVAIEGGNLFVHRGPGLAYNFVGVLYDGAAVFATGRDRISRWIRVELPDQPGKEGWITTETDYTKISGDLGNLPYVEIEPASPAYIRNCTKHQIWIWPADVYLMSKFNEPYNEERFNVGVYQVYDMENPDNEPIQDVDLSEGETVDIRYDWTGEKSKCE